MMLAGSAFELFDCAKNVDGFYYLNSEPSVRCGWPHAPNNTAGSGRLFPDSSLVVYRCTYSHAPVAASSTVAWSRDYLLVGHWCACTHSPHLPPCPNHSCPDCRYAAQRCTCTNSARPPPWHNHYLPVRLSCLYTITASSLALQHGVAAVGGHLPVRGGRALQVDPRLTPG